MRSRGQAVGRGRSLAALAALLFLTGLGGNRVLAQDTSPTPDASPVPSDSPVFEETSSPTPEAPTPSPTPAVTATPSATSSPTPTPAAPRPAPAPPPAPSGACLDFTSQEEAQAFYEGEGGPARDLHGLDPDGDGMACEDIQQQVETSDANSDPAHEQPQSTGEPFVVPEIVRTPARNTTKLVTQLECGLTMNEGRVGGMGRFPVAGRAYYSDDWLRPRYKPTPHLHKGLDIFAALGTPIRAPANGRIARLSDSPSSGGIGVSMEDDEGTWYYFGHLRERAAGLHMGQRVEIGTVLGYVGDSGNAKGGAPHLHIEIHRSGTPIPPKPILDRWLDDAIELAPDCVRSGPDASQPPTDASPPAPVPASDTMRTATPATPVIAPESVSASPAGGTADVVIPLVVLVAAFVVTPLVVRRRKRDEYSLIGW